MIHKLKLRKNDTLCRICHHWYSHHCLYANVEQSNRSFVYIDIVPCNGTYMNTGLTCGCLDYQPLDNLEYIEDKFNDNINENGKTK